MKFLRRVINNIDLMLPYTDVCIALYTQCFPSVCGKTSLFRAHKIRLDSQLFVSVTVIAWNPNNNK